MLVRLLVKQSRYALHVLLSGSQLSAFWLATCHQDLKWLAQHVQSLRRFAEFDLLQPLIALKAHPRHWTTILKTIPLEDSLRDPDVWRQQREVQQATQEWPGSECGKIFA